TFREALQRVREVALGAYAHQDLPFEQLVEELAPTRGRSRHPLFQVMFALQNTPPAIAEPPQLSGRRLAVEPQAMPFDLSLVLTETRAELIGTIDYSTRLFSAATIIRLAEHLQRLLESTVAHPDRRLADLPLLSAAERRQILLEWNDTRTEFRSQESGVRSAALCIHELFEAQATRTPDAVALVFDRGQGSGVG